MRPRFFASASTPSKPVEGIERSKAIRHPLRSSIRRRWAWTSSARQLPLTRQHQERRLNGTLVAWAPNENPGGAEIFTEAVVAEFGVNCRRNHVTIQSSEQIEAPDSGKVQNSGTYQRRQLRSLKSLGPVQVGSNCSGR